MVGFTTSIHETCMDSLSQEDFLHKSRHKCQSSFRHPIVGGTLGGNSCVMATVCVGKH